MVETVAQAAKVVIGAVRESAAGERRELAPLRKRKTPPSKWTFFPQLNTSALIWATALFASEARL